MTVDVVEFQRQARLVSQKFAAISEATLNTVIHVDKLTAKTGNTYMRTRLLGGQPFCRTTKPCNSNSKHTRTTGKGTQYRICLYDSTCNQQTHERSLGRMTNKANQE